MFLCSDAVIEGKRERERGQESERERLHCFFSCIYPQIRSCAGRSTGEREREEGEKEPETEKTWEVKHNSKHIT